MKQFNNSPVVFFGASKYVLPILDQLKANSDLTLVITTETNSNEPVSQFARTNNVELLTIKQFSNETINKIIIQEND